MKKELYDVRKDSDYEESYIDIDEWRERVLSDGRRIPFRYIHGGVKKKGLKYSFCFPKKEEFRGRFFSTCLRFRDRMRKWHLLIKRERMIRLRLH